MEDIILSGLWRATWQGAILCLFVAAFVKLTPRISPAIHCWAWRIVCLKMMVALFVARNIELPLLPAIRAPSMVPPTQVSNLKSVDLKSTGSPAFALEPYESQSNSPVADSADRYLFPWQQLLAGLWLIGGCFQLYRLIKDWRLVRSRLALAKAVNNDDQNKLLRTEIIEAQMAMCPQLLSDKSTDCPAIIGTLSPKLLIPESVLNESDDNDLRMLIRHELAHIRRGDLWWNWLAAATQLLFYFHPAVWLTLKEWRMSQESACDELALASRTEESAEYASMLLAIAVSKDPSRSLTYATGVFESFETLKRRIENMAHFGTRSKIRVSVAYSFVAVATLGLLPWKIVSQSPSGTQSVAAADVDNSSTRKQVDEIWISVADVSDVSGLKNEIRSDFSRLMNQIQPDIKTKTSSQQSKFANGSASASGFGGGAGGGAFGTTKFSGRPKLAIALNVETSAPSQVMILENLVGTDETGKEYKSLPTSSSASMVCPQYEKKQAGFTIAYFPKAASQVTEFATLSGTILVSMVESDSAEFRRLRKGAKIKTKLGEYEITEMKNRQGETKIAVQFPLPKSVRDALDIRPRNAAGFQKRVKAQQMLSGMIRTEFVVSDGLTYQPTSRASHGSGQETSSFTTFTGPNGTRTTSSGGSSSRKSGVVEYIYGFPNLPRNVRIISLKASVLEQPTATKEISFELANVKLR